MSKSKAVRPVVADDSEDIHLSRREADKWRTIQRRQARQMKYSGHTA